jgi:F0F1-type ATP synthase membrane subunit b/b'
MKINIRKLVVSLNQNAMLYPNANRGAAILLGGGVASTQYHHHMFEQELKNFDSEIANARKDADELYQQSVHESDPVQKSALLDRKKQAEQYLDNARNAKLEKLKQHKSFLKVILSSLITKEKN